VGKIRSIFDQSMDRRFRKHSAKGPELRARKRSQCWLRPGGGRVDEQSVRKNAIILALIRPLAGNKASVASYNSTAVYSVAFSRKSFRAEKSRTAPIKGTKTHPAFASGTAEMRGSP
jgi:hypothetical protein